MQSPVLMTLEARQQPLVKAHSSAWVVNICLMIRCPPSSAKPLPLMLQYSWLEDRALSLFPSACSLRVQQTQLSPLILGKQRKKHCSRPSISAADHKCLTFSDMFKPQSSGNIRQSGFQEICSDSPRPLDLP